MPELSATSAGRRELISFRVGAQEFCVDIMVVREIRGWTQATPLPHSPNFLRGVINLRGAVLPIVDLAARFGFESGEPSERQVVIVAQINGQLVGLLVDAVSDILTVDDGLVQPPPDIASEIVRSSVQGLLAIDQRMVSLISLDRLLPRPELDAA